MSLPARLEIRKISTKKITAHSISLATSSASLESFTHTKRRRYSAKMCKKRVNVVDCGILFSVLEDGLELKLEQNITYRTHADCSMRMRLQKKISLRLSHTP
jgi:hypothetical protein